MTRIEVSKLSQSLKKALYRPRVFTTSLEGTKRSGSNYGGWTHLDLPSLNGSTVLSLGLGEDASFDVEVAARYAARVVVFDPTPRAITHFHAITSRLGQEAESRYTSSGSQLPSSYDLRDVRTDQLELKAIAVSNFSGEADFFAPRDSSHVSYSLGNLQDSADEAKVIRVPVVDIQDVLEEFRSSPPSILKMDIEGAEVQVIPSMLASGVLPEQVLVEFDELNFPSRESTANFRKLHSHLQVAGYLPFYWDKRSCVSYVLRETV